MSVIRAFGAVLVAIVALASCGAFLNPDPPESTMSTLTLVGLLLGAAALIGVGLMLAARPSVSDRTRGAKPIGDFRRPMR